MESYEKFGLAVAYVMSPKAEKAATHQTLGFLERLVELAGGSDIESSILERSWEGDEKTILLLRWSQTVPC